MQRCEYERCRGVRMRGCRYMRRCRGVGCEDEGVQGCKCTGVQLFEDVGTGV